MKLDAVGDVAPQAAAAPIAVSPMRRVSQGFGPTFLCAVFLDLLGIAMVIPLMAPYMAHLGLSRTSLGAVQSIYGLMQVVCTPLLGTLADRVGHRFVLLLSLWGTAASFVVLAAAAHWVSVPLFFLSRVCLGAVRQTMATGSAVAIAAARNAAATGDENDMLTRRAKNLSLFNSAASFGFVVGPALGGAIAGSMDLASVALVAAACGACGGIAILAVLPGAHQRGAGNGDEKPMRSNPLKALVRIFRGATLPRRQLMLAIYCNSFAYILTQSYQPIAVADRFGMSAATRGLLISSGSAVNALSQASLLRVAQRYFRITAAQFIQVATFGTVVGYAVMLWALSASNVAVYCLGLLTVSLSAGVCDAITKSAFATSFPHETLAETLSLVTSVDGFNRVVGPLAAGVVADRVSPLAPSVISVAAAAACSVLQRAHFKHHEHQD